MLQRFQLARELLLHDHSVPVVESAMQADHIEAAVECANGEARVG